MSDEPSQGMKSAYELAMERLEKAEGKVPPLSDGQKTKLADIDSEMKARIAEVEIGFQQKLDAARATGEISLVEEMEQEKRRDIERIKSRAESEKNEVRQNPPPN